MGIEQYVFSVSIYRNLHPSTVQTLYMNWDYAIKGNCDFLNLIINVRNASTLDEQG